MATAEDTTIMNAHFKSYDDFSSRMVLLPNDDEECTGAKVGSHEVEVDADEDSAENDINDSCEACMEDMIVKIVKEQSNMDTQVPVGYVLTEIINSNTKATILTDLESIEYTDLLSFLRDASFPLSLVFVPPPMNESLDNSDTTSCDSSSSSDPLEVEESFGDDNSITNTESNESTTQSSSIASLNKEEAAKYAVQAASVLGGRLSTWGYQAATRAADAAKQVKELRDERQRRNNDEQIQQQNREEENGSNVDITTKPEVVDEKKEVDLSAVNAKEQETVGTPQKSSDDHIEPCFIFLQTPSGFEQLSNDDQDTSDGCLPSINNSSVISVRLSKDKACPLGKNGYTFQWYRSNSTATNSDDSKDIGDDKETITWSVLCGACYPAYQPSASDVGHKLQCIIKLGTAQQMCTIPQTISIEQSLFDSASTSLLGGGGDKSVAYGNLRGLEDLATYRLKVDVSSNDDYITSSSIFIDKMTTGDASDQSNTPILHFKVEADPAKPKLFAVVCSLHGRIRLEAANRKTRESLILALGIANYKGQLSSLTNTTILFNSYEDDDTTQSNALPSGQSESTHDSSYTKLLESKLTEMTRILQSKESSISKLQNDVAKSDAINKERSKQIETVQESERLLKDELTDKYNTIDNMTKAQQAAQIDQDKKVKALNNEISVLKAGIGARDTKIESLSSQIEDLSQKSSAQSQQLSSIEQLKSDLTLTQEKFNTSQKMIERMKRTEHELQNDLKETEGLVLNLNDKFTAAK